MHSSLNPSEIAQYNDMRTECLNLITEVVEWDEQREARSRRSHVDDREPNSAQAWEYDFEQRFGDPFRTEGRDGGPPGELGNIIMKFVGKVVNNNAALMQVIEIIRVSLFAELLGS